MTRRRAAVGIAVLAVLAAIGAASAAALGSVVINEVAWGGTAASPNDEWIELYNTADVSVDLAGWVLVIGETRVPLGAVGDATAEVRRATIEPHGYLLLERSDDETVGGVAADLVFKGGVPNSGADLRLLDASGAVADQVLCALTGWPAGAGSDGARPYGSMERVDPMAAAAQWATNSGSVAAGLDAEGTPLSGTPGAENSATLDFRTVPRVTLIDAPSGTLAGSVVVRWSATDPDGGPTGLRIALLVCDATGETCRVIAENLMDQGSYLWDVGPYVGEGEVFLRVVALDPNGLSGVAIAGPLTLAPAP